MLEGAKSTGAGAAVNGKNIDTESKLKIIPW